MMRKFFLIALALVTVSAVFAQDAKVPITSFEDEQAWAYTGNSIVFSGVTAMPDGKVPKLDGDNALYVEYDNAVGTWQWAQLNFPAAVDISGMREIHMSVFFTEDTEGSLNIRLDLPGGVGLGMQTAPSKGQWHELVWKIDRFTSPTLTALGNVGGFIAPDPGSNHGALYIDNVYAFRSASTPSKVDTVLLYGFNEENPDTGAPLGWSFNALTGQIGNKEVEPSEGSNYFTLYLPASWSEVMTTVDTRTDFARWQDVVDVQMDARVGEDYTGSWVQFGLVFQSGVTDVENAPNTNGWDDRAEQGFGDARENWKTLVWQVDMSKHAGAFGVEGGWFQARLYINQDSAAEGQTIYIDNFRIGAAASATDVPSWDLF